MAQKIYTTIVYTGCCIRTHQKLATKLNNQEKPHRKTNRKTNKLVLIKKKLQKRTHGSLYLHQQALAEIADNVCLKYLLKLRIQVKQVCQF